LRARWILRMPLFGTAERTMKVGMGYVRPRNRDATLTAKVTIANNALIAHMRP